MTSLTNHIKPGDDVSAAKVAANLTDLKAAASEIKERGIDPGSIDYRHLDGVWKYTTSYVDYSTTHTNPSDQLLLPTGPSTKTLVGFGNAPSADQGNPVLVIARMKFHGSGGNTQARLGIWVNGTQKTYVDVYVDTGHIQTVTLFHMFQSLNEEELIELRTGPDSSVTPQNFILTRLEMNIVAVRT
jgi:hypothetical protein